MMMMMMMMMAPILMYHALKATTPFVDASVNRLATVPAKH